MQVLTKQDLSWRSVSARRHLADLGVDGAIPTWDTLTPQQKELWAPRTAAQFGKLDDFQKVTFVLLAQRMVKAKLELNELHVASDEKALQRNRLYLQPRYKDSLNLFEKSVQEAIDSGVLQKSGAFPLFHGKTTIAARENRRADVAHLGVGSREVFIHMDEFNPRAGPIAFTKHAWELAQYAVGRRPNPIEISDRLEDKVFRHLRELFR